MPPDPPSLIVHTAWPYQSKIAGSGPATACGINPTFQLLGSKQHLPLVVIVTSLWHHKKSPLNAMCALVRPTPDALAFLLLSVKKIAMKSWEELCCWLAPSGLFFHTWLLKFHPLWSLSTVSQSPDDLVKARMMGGTVFWCMFLFPPPPPPELHETGTIQKHWNRATIYVKTKRVHKQLSEICTLKCGLKNCGKRNVMCKLAYGNCANSKHI